MLFPSAARDLVSYKFICRLSIWNAQQRFRQAHEDDALICRQTIFVHEGVDACML